MHIGVKHLNIFEDDILDPDPDSPYEVIGMPAIPALYPLMIGNLITLKDEKHVQTLEVLKRYYLLKGAQCESFLHFVLKSVDRNEVQIVKKFLGGDNIDYI